MRSIIFVLPVLSLLGCNSTEPQTIDPVVEQQRHQAELQHQRQMRMRFYEQLYLRGNFNQWSHEEAYRLNWVSDDTYAATAQLNRGNTYEFMFSAADASQQHANCGYHSEHHKRVKHDTPVRARCTGVVLENFEFTPTSDGIFEFFLDVTTPGRPMVYVRKAF